MILSLLFTLSLLMNTVQAEAFPSSFNEYRLQFIRKLGQLDGPSLSVKWDFKKDICQVETRDAPDATAKKKDLPVSRCREVADFLKKNREELSGKMKNQMNAETRAHYGGTNVPLGTIRGAGLDIGALWRQPVLCNEKMENCSLESSTAADRLAAALEALTN